MTPSGASGYTSRSRWNPELPPDPYATDAKRPSGESVRQSVHGGANNLFFIIWFVVTIGFGVVVSSTWGDAAGDLAVLIFGYAVLTVGAWMFTRIIN